MEFKITSKIAFNENENDFRKSVNPNMFDYTYVADSDEVIPNGDFAVLDFKITNANKFVYDLKPNNNFDILIKEDILKCNSIDNVVSLHIFCYESTSIKPFKTPIKFDVTLEDVNFTLGSMSEFSIGNIKGLSSDVRINNIIVPIESKATLVIIAATKD